MRKILIILKMLYTWLLLPLLKLLVKSNTLLIVNVSHFKIILVKGLFNPRSGISTLILVKDTLRVVRTLSRQSPTRYADLCSGSGIIGIALARSLSKAQVVLIDVDPRAARISRTNCVLNGVYSGVDIVCADGLSCFRDCSFSLIVCNPPYLPCPYRSDTALCCGIRGELLIKLLRLVARCLKKDGSLVFSLSSLSPYSSEIGEFCSVVSEVMLGPDVLRVASCSRRQLLKFLGHIYTTRRENEHA